jgi:hypothetical protein
MSSAIKLDVRVATAGLALAATLSLVPEVATADDTPSSSIHSVIQQGEDVEIQLWFSEYSWPHYGQPTSLIRLGPAGEKAVYEDGTFAVEDAVWVSDSGNDFHFAVLDECVPPGATTYELYYSDLMLSDMDIEVEDVGQHCSPGAGGDGDGGCSASRFVGAKGTGPLTALTLLAFGLAALWVARRRDLRG